MLYACFRIFYRGHGFGLVMRLAPIVLLLLITQIAHAASAIQLETISNPPGVHIKVRPTARSGWGLLQVIDPATGTCLRTIHAGRITPRDSFAVVRSALLPPGNYRLRYREGVELALEAQIERPDGKVAGWLNPTDIALAGPWVYVLDSGQEVVDPKTPEEIAEQASKQPLILKMDRQGKLDPTFGEAGALALPGLYRLRSFAVDRATGKLFAGSGGHEVRVYDANGSPTEQVIGGWDNDPAGPKSLAWCDSIALGHSGRIYIALSGYGNGKVYDRSKNGFDGWLYRFDLPDVNGVSRMICSDAQGVAYCVGASHLVTRYIDDEKSLTITYQSDPQARLAFPTGGSASGGLVWWACHGPGFGPFWDSGGGGEVVLFWDTGEELKLIDRFGIPGTAPDQMEFLNPAAAVMDARHDELWVSEDGLPNKEGPAGNARVRRFLLKARHSEEADFNLPG